MTYFYPPDMQRRNERDRDKSIRVYGEGEFPEVKQREFSFRTTTCIFNPLNEEVRGDS